MTFSLDTFLNPESIAVIGASADHTKLRGKLCEFIVKNGYSGTLYFINPSHRSLSGRPCYPNMAALPGPVDLAIIVVPASGVLDALKECAHAGARNALIMSSGFAEEGGAQSGAQEEIAEVGRRTGIRICGPNAEGFHNEIKHISATFSPAVDLDPATLFTAAPRRCGIIAQSGGIGFSLYHRGRALGLNFSRVITVGNEVDLCVADFLLHMVEDDETSTIILFLEMIRKPDAFLAAAQRAAMAKKPIVVVKVGRSAAGGRATASHTGSMAGFDAAYMAAFQKYGVIVVDDLTRALAAAAAFTTCPLPRGRRAAIVTVSGGGGALMADALESAGLDLPVLRPDTQAEIRAMIPSFGSTHNPVDVTGQATRTGAPLKVIKRLAEGDEVDIIVAVTTMANTTRPPVDPEGLKEIVSAQKKPILFYTYTVPSDFGLRSLAQAQSVTFIGATDIGAAAGALVAYADFRPPAPFAPAERGRDGAASLLKGLSGVLSEYRSKDILRGFGIPFAPHRLVRTRSDLKQASESIGFPVAVKIQSPDIPHKTDAGGVRLQIADAASLAAAFHDVMAAARSSAPAARIEGVLIEPMAPRGIEMIVGAIRDDTFGPMITVGLGGVYAELFQDVSRRLAPVTKSEAVEMLRELKTFPRLDGYRGAPKADISSFADLIVRISEFAAAYSDRVGEVELNPVIVHDSGRGLSIVDAMIVVRPDGDSSATTRQAIAEASST